MAKTTFASAFKILLDIHCNSTISKSKEITSFERFCRTCAFQHSFAKIDISQFYEGIILKRLCIMDLNHFWHVPNSLNTGNNGNYDFGQVSAVTFHRAMCFLLSTDRETIHWVTPFVWIDNGVCRAGSNNVSRAFCQRSPLKTMILHAESDFRFR